MSLTRFIAFRLGSGSDNLSRPAVRISIAGVAIGLAIMIVSVAVVMGFKHTIRDKVAGFGSHIQVGDFMTLQTGDAYPIQMNDSMMTVLKSVGHVRHVQRFANVQGILKTDADFLGVQLKGMGQEYDTAFIYQHLVAGRLPRFSDEKSSQELLISQWMAQRLKLKTGDRLFAYFIDAQGVRTRRFTVTGIYQTYLSQYDEMVCMTDLHTVQRLHRWEADQVSGAELTIAPIEKMDEVASILIQRVNRTTDGYGEVYTSRTIRELNPEIFYWLDLLDMNVWIILILMLAVAGVTMTSGLLIIILERASMIGILKSVGMRNRAIRHTFLWLAARIVGRGMLLGNIIALILLLIQRYFGIVTLDPEVYYVHTMPVEFNLLHILLLNLLTFIMCLMVLILPSHVIAFIRPARTMKFE